MPAPSPIDLEDTRILRKRYISKVKPNFCAYPLTGLPWQLIPLQYVNIARQKRKVMGTHLHLLEMDVQKQTLACFTISQAAVFLCFMLRGQVQFSDHTNKSLLHAHASCCHLSYLSEGRIFVQLPKGRHSLLLFVLNKDWFHLDQAEELLGFLPLIKAFSERHSQPLILEQIPINASIRKTLRKIRRSVLLNVVDRARVLKYIAHCLHIYHTTLHQRQSKQIDLQEKGAMLKQYLSENYRFQEACTLKEIQARLDWSHTTLQRIAKQYLGSSIRTYLYKLRLEKAIELLKTSHMPIHEIAVRIGYSSDIAFIRAFKHSMHIAPHQYRLKLKT